MTFDKFDRKILIALERDGRLTNLDLAQEID
jgi:DNA-binding Lrp family transcriptional regulator